MPSLKDKIKTKKPPRQPKGPAWKGPEVDGVTQSLLGRFLGCRERFRVLTVEGLQPAPQFNARLEFGNMWHICEEWLAGGGNESDCEEVVRYAKDLCRKYPLQQEQIDHWFKVTRALFPLYVKHWEEHPDVKDRTPILAEQTFNIPYSLPSGRIVRLRGKWDSVDLVGKGKNAGIWLRENKTKSSIDAGKIHRQLKFDLQTMLYLVALFADQASIREQIRPDGLDTPLVKLGSYRISGVRYNVIRRSAHKSVESMLKKLEGDRAAGRIGEWFSRWNVEVTAGDIARFRRECLDPILEQLCDWWWGMTGVGGPVNGDYRGVTHWRHPFGVYNSLDEGGFGDVDEYLDTGSTVGLQRVKNLFPELT